MTISSKDSIQVVQKINISKEFSFITNLFFSNYKGSKSSDWVVVDDKFTDETLTTSIKTSSSSNETGFTKSNYSSTTNTNSSAGAATLSANGEATKRFANAKSISSDQYFGTNRMSEVILT